jgi:drug/metabolite transporter (DMT)-like permease
MRDSRRIPILMTLLAALLWASSFSVIKVGLRYIDPFSFLFIRFVLATALLAGAALASGSGALMLRYAGNPYSIILGLALAASFSLQFRAQVEIPASTAAIIINSSTLLVAPLSALLLRERIGGRKVAAMALGIAGVYLTTVAPAGAPSGAGGATWLGRVLISASAVSTALYIVLTKKALSERHLHQLPLLASVFAWSLPVYMLLALPALRNGLTLSGRAWLAIAYLAVFCSGLAFLLWATAMKRIGALTSAIVLLSELVFGVLMAVAFLGEGLSARAVAGCALIGLGIIIVGVRE